MSPYTYRYERHHATGWNVLHLFYEGAAPHERTHVALVPEMGANLLAFDVGEHAFIVEGDRTNGRFALLGTPILYPTPNRVRGARFTFDGREFTFPPNNGRNFIHGLVRERPWECDTPHIGDESIRVTARYRFLPGDEAFALFPIRNTLEVTFTVRPRTVRFDFTIYNEDTSQRLPFGLALHPYFAILGDRSQVRIQVPAQRWMEAEDLLPTGRLLPLEEGPADLRKPTSLEALNLDDVFWGLTSQAPQIISYEAIGVRLVLSASEHFTHSVIYTPKGRPFFCIENQTCSTDAHNLYARGLEREAHLMILNPGEAMAAWVQYTLTNLGT